MSTKSFNESYGLHRLSAGSWQGFVRGYTVSITRDEFGAWLTTRDYDGLTLSYGNTIRLSVERASEELRRIATQHNAM